MWRPKNNIRKEVKSRAALGYFLRLLKIEGYLKRRRVKQGKAIRFSRFLKSVLHGFHLGPRSTQSSWSKNEKVTFSGIGFVIAYRSKRLQPRDQYLFRATSCNGR